MFIILFVNPFQSLVVDDACRILCTFVIVFAKHWILNVLLHDVSYYSSIPQSLAVTVQEVRIIKMCLELANVTIEFINSTFVWCRRRTFVSACPLTENTCIITFIFEHFWKNLMLWIVRFLTNDRKVFVYSIFYHWHVSPILFVASYVGMSAMLACHDCSTGRSRNRRTSICLRKAHTLFSHLVDVRSMDIWLAIASQVTISHIITEDKEDIRLLYVLFSPSKGR